VRLMGEPRFSPLITAADFSTPCSPRPVLAASRGPAIVFSCRVFSVFRRSVWPGRAGAIDQNLMRDPPMIWSMPPGFWGVPRFTFPPLLWLKPRFW
jgi:hypothetical protein